jgi:outer membrane protein assembly factor BamE (lipoprotein component of BamABCDE complex)
VVLRTATTLWRSTILALLCAALAACAPPGAVIAGKSFDYGLSKREKIVKGVTTKAEIQTLFGTPYHTTTAGGDETWEYYSREAGRDEAYADRTLVIDFNDHSVVTDFKYKWKETKSPVNTSGTHGRGGSPAQNAPGDAPLSHGCGAPPPPGNPFLPESTNQKPVC